MPLQRVKYYPALFFFIANIFALVTLHLYQVRISLFFYLIILLGLLTTFMDIFNLYKIVILFIITVLAFLIFYKYKPDICLNINIDIGKYFNKKMRLFSKLDNFNFLSSIVLGNRHFLKKSIKQTFSLTGSYHFLAISGLHFGIAASIFHFVFKFFKSKYKYVFIIILLFFYLATVDFYVSALRAFLMILFFYLGKYFKKRTYSLNIWALATLFILIFNESYITKLGFWMSIMATLGIILSLEYLDNIKNIFLKLIFISLSAQLFLLPILLVYFNRINIISPIINTIGVVFIYPILSIGFTLMLPLPLFISKGLIYIVEVLIKYFILFISFFKREIFIVNFELNQKYLYIYYFLIIILFFYLKYVFKGRKK